MRRASQLFTAAERSAIAAAVTAAERGTSAEIVPVVATRSGRYDRAEDLFGLLAAIGLLVAGWCLLPGLAASDWNGLASSAPSLPLAIALVLLGFVAGTALASRYPALCAPLIAAAEVEDEVERSARALFQRQGLRATSGGTGVLIYLSLFERRVRVIGDEAIAARLGPEDWQAICDRVVAGMRQGQPAQGLEQALALTGELLARHFPALPDDSNELADRLLLVD